MHWLISLFWLLEMAVAGVELHSVLELQLKYSSVNRQIFIATYECHI